MDQSFTFLVLIGWVPACAVLFALMSPVRAVSVAFSFGWLFLPVARVSISGLPDIDKVMSTSLGVFCGIALFQPALLARLRFGWAEVLLLFFAISVYVTSVVNGLGSWDGMSATFSQVLNYGVPFVFGRALLNTPRDRWEAGRVFVGFAAIYAVLAVWEWRMSPQLHASLYGFYPQERGFMIAARWGFYRPILFFSANLALGTYFAWTTVLAWWMYLRKQLTPMFGVPAEVLVALPTLGLLTSMSLGPWILAIGGLGILWVWSRTGARWIVVLPACFAFAWMSARYTGVTQGDWLTRNVEVVSEERAASLQYRIDAEELLLEHAKERPIFGWGGWGRNRVYDEQGESVTAVDGLWIIYVGIYGLSGLTLFFLWWCYPLLISARVRAPFEGEAVVMALLVAVAIQSCNLVFNAFVSPVLTLACGGLVTNLTAALRQTKLLGQRTAFYHGPVAGTA